MSYMIYVYPNDPRIEETVLYTGDFQSRVPYDSDEGVSKSHENFGDFARFTATPAPGYEFARFVYRLGSTSDTVNYSYENPFVYTGDQNIYLRAEGKAEQTPDETWDILMRSRKEPLSENYDTTFSVDGYTLFRLRIKFEEAHSAVKFYTSGSNVKALGYLNRSGDYDEETGFPLNRLVTYNNISDGNDCAFSYGVLADTYYYVWIRAENGAEALSAALHIEFADTGGSSSRPRDFAWTYDKVKGEGFNLTAAEWNSFTARIGAFRKYKKLSAKSFTDARKGEYFTAAIYNEAREAIRDIPGYGTYIPEVSGGDEVTAYIMNIIVSELNAVP